MNRSVLIYGVDDIFTIQLMESMRRTGTNIAGGILLKAPQWELKGIPAVLQRDEITERHRQMDCMVPDNASIHRRRVVRQARADGFGVFYSHIDRTAIVADTALIGRGCFIDTMVGVGGAVQLDDFVTLCWSSSIGHHCVVEDFVTIGPNAVIASSGHLCEGCYIGAGSSARPGIRVGEGAIVGAGSVLVKDVEPYTVVAGNPATVLREVNYKLDPEFMPNDKPTTEA